MKSDLGVTVWPVATDLEDQRNAAAVWRWLLGRLMRWGVSDQQRSRLLPNAHGHGWSYATGRSLMGILFVSSVDDLLCKSTMECIFKCRTTTEEHLHIRRSIACLSPAKKAARTKRELDES